MFYVVFVCGGGGGGAVHGLRFRLGVCVGLSWYTPKPLQPLKPLNP